MFIKRLASIDIAAFYEIRPCVSDSVNEFLVVTCHDDRRSTLNKRTYNPTNQSQPVHIKSLLGFIKKQELHGPDESKCKCKELRLPGGKLVREPLTVAINSKSFESFVCTFQRNGKWVSPGRCNKRHMLPKCQISGERRQAQKSRNLLTEHGSFIIWNSIGNQHAPPGGPDRRSQHTQQRCLSRTVRSGHRQRSTSPEHKRYLGKQNHTVHLNMGPIHNDELTHVVTPTVDQNVREFSKTSITTTTPTSIRSALKTINTTQRQIK